MAFMSSIAKILVFAPASSRAFTHSTYAESTLIVGAPNLMSVPPPSEVGAGVEHSTRSYWEQRATRVV